MFRRGYLVTFDHQSEPKLKNRGENGCDESFGVLAVFGNQKEAEWLPSLEEGNRNTFKVSMSSEERN